MFTNHIMKRRSGWAFDFGLNYHPVAFGYEGKKWLVFFAQFFKVHLQIGYVW